MREVKETKSLKSENIKQIYHSKEVELLNSVEDYINQDKKYSDFLNRISSTSLIKEDYITFYIYKYIENKIALNLTEYRIKLLNLINA